jgi:DNA modification methylase
MSVTILQGHNITELRKLPEKSIQCCVTSPPYWGLRDYGTEPQIWGGDETCQHEWGSEMIGKAQGQRNGEAGGLHEGRETNKLEDNVFTQVNQGNFCQKCNQWRGELGR